MPRYKLDGHKIYHGMSCHYDNRCQKPKVVKPVRGEFLIAEIQPLDPEMGIHLMPYTAYFIAKDSANQWCAKSPDKHHYIPAGSKTWRCSFCRKRARLVSAD